MTVAKNTLKEKITKSGRKELRWAMVEAAWRAVGMSPYWKEQYEKYLQRLRRPSQAIVVVARKLLVVVWHILSKEETDEHASEEDWPTRCCYGPGVCLKRHARD